MRSTTKNNDNKVKKKKKLSPFRVVDVANHNADDSTQVDGMNITRGCLRSNKTS